MVAERDWGQAVSLLSQAPRVALACHVEPDGDALGSMLALYHHLRATGCEVVAAFGVADGGPDQVPAQYAFLPGVQDLVPADDFPPAPEVLVVLDCAAASRLGRLEGAARRAGTVVVVDHHANGTPFGDIRLVDHHGAATAVLVEELIRRSGGRVDQVVATCLYTGLVTDTGRFAFSSVTPAVMELGARLLGCRIDHTTINQQVWDTHSLGYVKLLGRACDRATFVPEVGLAWTAVYQRDLEELAIAAGEVDGVVDVLRGVACADVTLVLREQPRVPATNGAANPAGGRRALEPSAQSPGVPEWKLSLRSRGRVDVGRIAAVLGGGGHAYAAGCVLGATLPEVVDRVVALLHAAADPALVG